MGTRLLGLWHLFSTQPKAWEVLELQTLALRSEDQHMGHYWWSDKILGANFKFSKELRMLDRQGYRPAWALRVSLTWTLRSLYLPVSVEISGTWRPAKKDFQTNKQTKGVAGSKVCKSLITSKVFDFLPKLPTSSTWPEELTTKKQPLWVLSCVNESVLA